MTTTPVLGADELVSGQAIPETTENQRGRRFEQGAQYFNVLDRTLTSPPGSPADGDAHIVGTSATGAWSGKDKSIAFYQSGTGWLFITPRTGFRAYSQADATDYRYASGAWSAVTAGSSGGLLAANNLSDVASATTSRTNLGLGTAATLASDTDGTLAANSDSNIATQKAVKTYVDGKVAGLSWKQAVRAATTTAGTLASSFANGSTIDGVALATGDRILVKNQATASENGIYVVAASGTPARATDADSGAELVNATCYVSEGTTNADTQWTCTTNATITVGTTSLAFAQLSSGGSSITAKDEGSTLTTGMTSIDFVGAGVTATNSGAAVTVTIGGGSGNAWNLQWSPFQNEAPSSNYATLDTRNGHPCLDFDTTTQETAIFSGVLPADYSGAGVTVYLWCSLTSATTGTVGWDVAFERMDASSLDIDADSFGSATTVTATTVPGTSGQFLKMSVNVSNGANMDSLAAGEMFRLRIRRDVANDTATGDAELLRVMLVSQ